MKFLHLFLIVAAPFSLAAADTATRLQELMKRYPEADANGVGVLTAEEAQTHANKLRKQKKQSRPQTAKDPERAGEAQDGARRPTPTHADVSYGADERNKLDLWIAKSDRPTPLVVFIHGGGFVNGSKAVASPEMISGCVDAGVSFMAINYRYRTTAPIQDILRDCARSIQFIRSKAKEYNIDPTRVAVYGGSAGAGTSLWLAFHPDLADPKNRDPVLRESSRVRAAGALNTQATYNLRRWPEFLPTRPGQSFERPGEVTAFYGKTSDAELDEAKAILDDVDMLSLVSPDDPPVFMYTSQADGPVADRGQYLHHPNHARAVKKACDAAGVRATVFFAQADPRLEGNHLHALREFLLAHLKSTAP
ncbi:MAG: alpha/beta hydrolase [Opitutaceae bacterium]|nr:alpha/beta hydrolase [Opitutaceae bacterium]